MLMQSPAVLDDEQLEPSADAEDGKVGRQGGPHQGEFPGVPVRAGRLGLRVPGLAVPARINVSAGGEHKAVEAVD